MFIILLIRKTEMNQKCLIKSYIHFNAYRVYCLQFLFCSWKNCYIKYARQSLLTYFYLIIFFILGLYAIIWQQVLKIFPLNFAYTNKAAIIIWGMLWSKLFFGEQFTLKKIIAVLLVFTGIVILNLSKPKEASDE